MGQVLNGDKKSVAKAKVLKLDKDVRLSSDVRPLLKGLKLTGYEDQDTRRLMTASQILKNTGGVSLRPVLPCLLNLKGKPYHLADHFPFVPFFKIWVPRNSVLKTGRQVSKSTSLAAQGVVISNCIPYFSTLYVTPLYEMIRRFSNNYVKPFIDTSPVRRLFSGSSTVNSVLQRSFHNESQMHFSFAFLDAERTRGVSADKNSFDEVQDMDPDFIPIIKETMSHSKWGITQYAGTPKTLANTLENLWQHSSQCEWVIKCHHGGCGYWNVPALTHDLIEMIGPDRDDISEKRPGVVCAKCQKPLQPRPVNQGGFGRWIAAHPERNRDFMGLHVPQIIMPLHYNDPEKWRILKGKQRGAGNTQHHVFLNEVCGESCDTGATLVTITDLKRAAVLPWKRQNVDEVCRHLGDYTTRVLAVDWGGGGEKGVSFTTLALLGYRPDGKVDVPWAHRSLTPHDHLAEAKLCLQALNKFKCQVIVHDYTGAGALRETFIAQSGFPYDRIIPIAYVRAASGDVMQCKEATVQHPREYYQVDKTRSLQLTTQLLKLGMLRTFQYDHENEDNAGLLHDFLALVEEKTDSRMGKDLYTIIRNPQFTDDFAQAVNIGCCALFYMNKQWPNIAVPAHMIVGQDALDAAHPSDPDWED